MGAQARPIGVVIHERNLLRGFICGVEVALFNKGVLISTWGFEHLTYLVKNEIQPGHEVINSALKFNKPSSVVWCKLGAPAN